MVVLERKISGEKLDTLIGFLSKKLMKSIKVHFPRNLSSMDIVRRRRHFLRIPTV